MKRLAMSFLLALLSYAMAIPSCAHIQPVINTVVTCSGKTISPALVDEVYTDILTENWGDLAVTAIQALPSGWADVVCIYDALKDANPALVGHMEKLEAAHVELRGAVSLRCPGDPTPKTGPTAMIPRSATGSMAASDTAGARSNRAEGTSSPTVQRQRRSPLKRETLVRSEAGERLAACDVVCGGPRRSLAPPSGCLCQRKVDGSLRWVAAR